MRKKAAPVRLPDFQECPLLVFKNIKNPGKLTEKDFAAWDNTIPFSPKMLYDLFSSGYDRPAEVKVYFSEEGDLKIKVGFPKSEDLDLSFCVKLDDGLPEIHTLNIRVAEQAQGAGLGKASMRNMLEFAKAMGAQRVDFSAGLTGGAYSWSRMAVHVDVDRLKPEDSLPVLSRLESIKDRLAEQDYFAARKYCQMKDKQDMANLARMDHIVLPIEMKPEIENAHDHPIRQGIRAFLLVNNRPEADAAERSLAETKAINKAFEAAALQKKDSITLPRFLQPGFSFPAYIDFMDAEQMGKVGTYLGGWKTLQPRVVSRSFQPAEAFA